jgi:hypothetical protein
MRICLLDPIAITAQAALQLVMKRDEIKDARERAELDLKILGLIHSVWMRAQLHRWMHVSA